MARPMKLTSAIVLASAALFVAACGSEPAPSGDAALRGTSAGAARQISQEAVPVSVLTVRPSTSSAPLAFPAQVEGNRRVAISTRLMARIDHIRAREGDPVTEGDTLVELDRSALDAEKARAEAARQQAEAALSAAANQLRRFIALEERGSATERELEEVRTMHESAQAGLAAAEGALAAAREQLTHAVITSPVTGHVVARYAEAGATAAPGRPILEVETTSDLRVVALVPEGQVSRLREGDPVTVEIDAARMRLEGRLATINRGASAPARQFRVEVDRLRAAGDASMETLRPGMYARLLVTAAPADGARQVTSPGQVATPEQITIPVQAVVRRGQLTGVWIVPESRRVRLRWVRLGAARDGEVEVLSGLQSGERIVLEADGRLVDGQEVREQ